ncbi:uncharacterized protein LOC143041791 [Oratosquilla oratoria]|uniref:uncharacterized protein LOC143041791 n=1 Tax=Oratosquilla oratoria TaxID=337810 RepID=UPI003F759729
MRLAYFAEANNMMIGGTCFQHKNLHKYTWISTKGRTRNQIDHVLTNKKHRPLQEVRSFRGADCDSDHILLIAKIEYQLKISKKTQNQPQKKFNVERLNQQKVRTNYEVDLRNRFEILQGIEGDADLEEKAKILKESIIGAAEEIVGYKERRRGETWCDEECRKALEESKTEMVAGDETEEEYHQKRKEAKRINGREKR